MLMTDRSGNASSPLLYAIPEIFHRPDRQVHDATRLLSDAAILIYFATDESPARMSRDADARNIVAQVRLSHEDDT